ncbi:MAG TPA: zf-HC2 domain-containing protein [Polyangiales bacterium]|nr:zf-HC2 domain-containing protein [Polyangiales bacterium]
MSAACTSEPVSQLRLERYALSELPAGEHAQVEAHLARCPACRQCLLELSASEPALRSLPQELPQLNQLPLAAQRIELPERRPQPRAPSSPRVRRLPWSLPRVAGGLALAAALLLALRAGLQLPRAGVDDANGRDSGRAVKGGELALELVRARAGDVALDPRSFASGDRFAVLVTCPPPAPAHWELVVFQAGEAFFPLDSTQPLRCGNRVSLPGAFALTGAQPAQVCVVLSAAPADRATLSRGPDALPAQHACTTVSAEARP